MMDPISNLVAQYLIPITAQLIMPIMLTFFFGGIAIRVCLYYVASAESRFAAEFEKRVIHHFNNPDAPKVPSFSRLLRILLTKTHHECYNVRNKYKRRDLDYISSVADRVFMVEDGIVTVVRDSLKQARYMRKEGATPKMIEVSKNVFENNTIFNRLFGVIPVGRLNDILGILPGLFIIGGIFGTFLGISQSLPDLGTMDMGDMNETKRVMDLFLVKISQAMIKSIIGIGFSVIMSVVNTLLSVEGTFYHLINRFANALELVWNETTTNEVDKADPFVAAEAQELRPEEPKAA
jgi:hypothetical protein